jgi:hypothetical protein
MNFASVFSPCKYEIFIKSSHGWPHTQTKECFFIKHRICRAYIEEKMHEISYLSKTIILSKRLLRADFSICQSGHGFLTQDDDRPNAVANSCTHY